MERIDSDLPDWPVPYSVVADVFDPPKVAYGETWDQEDDFLVARDRCGPRAAIAVVSAEQPAGRWWECMVYVRAGDEWAVDAQEGDLWPLDPAAPRPEAAGFAHLTAPLPYRRRDRAGACVLRGGVAGAGVATVEVVTMAERHQVEVDAGSGAFVALAQLGDGDDDDDATVELVARTAGGTIVERATATIGPDDWARHAHLPPGPPPDWLHGPLEAVVGDLTRAGGAPDGLTLSYSPNGAGGTVWVTHRLPDRWGFGIDALDRGPTLLERLAGELQECWHELPDVFGVALPPCPDHPHAAIAVVRDGAAWWICPATDRLLAPVGSYAP
jgi:hypothetical protein